jgi:hypothetical protein
MVTLVCRYLLAALFLAAAITKITDLTTFENQVLLHSSLPYPVGLAVVVVLPWLELVCGACLALGRAVREAALLSAVLLIFFSSYSLVYRTGPDCYCFFVGPAVASPGWWWPPLRNVLFLLCSLRVACSRSTRVDGQRAA